MQKSILILFLISFIHTFMYGQCQDFEKSVSNWKYFNVPTGANNPNPITSCNSISGPGFNSNNSLFVTDKSGSTFIYNEKDFRGDYSKLYGKCLCFDIQLLNNNATVKPAIILYNGFDPTQKIQWGVNPKLAIKFTANEDLPVNGTWKNICVSFAQCSEGYMPNNIDGTWQVLGKFKNECEAFTKTLRNVEGALFAVDMSGWPGTERFRLDNICKKDCRTGTEPTPPNDEVTYDVCCPPVLSDDLSELFEFNFSGGIGSSYTVTRVSNSSFDQRLQAYANYLNALCPSVNKLQFHFGLHNQLNFVDDGQNLFAHYNPGNPSSQLIGGITFTSNPQLQVNKWYRIHLGVYTVQECGLISKECDVAYIDWNVQVQGKKRILNTKFNGVVKKFDLNQKKLNRRSISMKMSQK